MAKNAYLCNLIRNDTPNTAETMLPLDFIDMMVPQMGTELDAFCRAIEQEPLVSVRLNSKTNAKSDILQLGKRVPWCESGYYLQARPQFTLDPWLHAGCYYVQEASSMFLEQVLRQYVRRDAIVLDMCAAPGGKSTLLSEYLTEGGLLISNEVVRQRVFILSENIQKWGNGNTVVTHNQAKDFGERLPNLFDCILVDAPCSGEGMFRKDKQAVDEWSERNVQMCAERQRKILGDVWDALRPGGIMIYSTCTFNTKEDEENAQWIAEELGAEILPVHTEPEWGITQTKGYHFYPHKVQGEGFYLCAFRKDDASYAPFRPKTEKKKTAQAIEFEKEIRSWLQHPAQWALRQQERFVNAYPLRHKELIDYLSTQLICISTGIGLSEQRGKGIAPQHSLSMAKDLRQEAFNRVAVDKPTALSYLRLEAIVLDNQPVGILLLTYQGVALGFVKNIGGHCNNLYPKEWRIRVL